MIKFIAIFGLVALLVGAFSAIYVLACEDEWCAVFDWQKIKITTSFTECANHGFPVMESFPRQCRAGEKVFIEDISTSTDPFLNQFEPPAENVGEFEIEIPKSGIRGKVLMGPTCPVEREGDDCGDKPYETKLRIYTEDRILLKAVLSDKNGNFEIGLEPGTYVLEGDGETVMPYAAPQIVIVSRDKFTDVTFRFDSGIR